LATTINDDVFSLLSTATQATSPAIPWMEWAQIKEQLAPTLEDNYEEDNSNNDGDRNDDVNVGSGSGGDCNNMSAKAGGLLFLCPELSWRNHDSCSR
jgi:hypothetical protein